jgi:hypothetical protein
VAHEVSDHKRKASQELPGKTKKPAAPKKAAAPRKNRFGVEVPYWYKKNVATFLEAPIDTGSESFDSEEDGADDGFNIVMKGEEHYEELIEGIEDDLRLKLQVGMHVPAGDIRGEWDIHSPNYLDPRKVDRRPLSWGGEFYDFRNFKRGKLSIGNVGGEGLVKTLDVIGLLDLDGFEEVWRIPMNIPQFASGEVQPVQAIRKRDGYSGHKDSEVQLGFWFLGNGYLKFKIPAISLSGIEEAGRFITLYGINRSVHLDTQILIDELPPIDPTDPDKSHIPTLPESSRHPTGADESRAIIVSSAEPESSDIELSDIEDSALVDWPSSPPL